MVTVQNSIQELERTLARRDDVPRFYTEPSDTLRSRSSFREYKSNYNQGCWETRRDNGSLYPSEDSYVPYLEMV